MSSLDTGKKEVCEWIRANFPHGASCLDVGACDGKWAQLLDGYLTIDAVEVFQKYVYRHNLMEKYRQVYIADIRKFEYDNYDLIIFGDILEHMTVTEAQTVIRYAWNRCRDMLIAVPYMWEQGAIRHNPYEVHVQPDLTPEIFEKRYPGFEPIFQVDNYAYYTKGDITCSCPL